MVDRRYFVCPDSKGGQKKAEEVIIKLCQKCKRKVKCYPELLEKKDESQDTKTT